MLKFWAVPLLLEHTTSHLLFPHVVRVLKAEMCDVRARRQNPVGIGEVAFLDADHLQADSFQGLGVDQQGVANLLGKSSDREVEMDKTSDTPKKGQDAWGAQGSPFGMHTGSIKALDRSQVWAALSQCVGKPDRRAVRVGWDRDGGESWTGPDQLDQARVKVPEGVDHQCCDVESWQSAGRFFQVLEMSEREIFEQWHFVHHLDELLRFKFVPVVQGQVGKLGQGFEGGVNVRHPPRPFGLVWSTPDKLLYLGVAGEKFHGRLTVPVVAEHDFLKLCGTDR